MSSIHKSEAHPPMVSAEVILKSATGHRLDHAGASVTADNVAGFAPTQQTIAAAKQRLEQLGFLVVSSGITLTILGAPETFKQVFGVCVQVVEVRDRASLNVKSEGELEIPPSLKEYVDAVVFPEPPEFFG